MRKPSYEFKLKGCNRNPPTLDNLTRWFSTYKMCKNILELKGFIEVEKENNACLKLSSIEWKNLKQLVELLYPLYQLILS